MRRSIVLLRTFLAIILIYSPVAAIQQSAPLGEWNSVKAVPIGEELIVKLKDGQTVRGKLASITDTTLNMTGKNNKTETLGKGDISQVYQLKGKASKAKYALIGAGVGAAVGGGAGAAKNSPPIDDGGIYVVMGLLIGTGIGAVAGTLFGMGRRKRVLIYQAS